MTEKKQIMDWWANNPMTYGSAHGRATYGDEEVEMGTMEFFQHVDERFYSWTDFLHGDRYFERLFPYDTYAGGARVLEIGCGMGTMAMNWAKNGADVTAIDLNPVSVRETLRRFSLFGLKGDIRQMDSNELDFPNDFFDYVYSWGVLHHSPNLRLSLSEMLRVLRPGGGFGLMLYCRSSIRYWYRIKYVEGLLHYEGKFLGPLELASRYTDGEELEGNPFTWPVTPREVRQMLTDDVHDLKISRIGGELDGIFKRLVVGLGLVLPQTVVETWARHLGWSLWVTGQRTTKDKKYRQLYPSRASA